MITGFAKKLINQFVYFYALIINYKIDNVNYFFDFFEKKNLVLFFIDIINKMIYNKNIRNFFKLIIIKKFIKRRNNGRNKKISFWNR